MNWLRNVFVELWGLFVEDGSFAAAILLWIAIAVFLLPTVLPGNWTGPVTFFGLAAILVENVIRSARRLRKR